MRPVAVSRHLAVAFHEEERAVTEAVQDNYPWLWRPGAAVAENLPGFLAEPVGIDAAGRVAGGAVVVQPNGSLTALPLDGVPLGMNSNGEVVGRLRASPQNVVIWNGGGWQTLFSVGSGQDRKSV